MTYGGAIADGFHAPGPADFELNDIFGGNVTLLTKSSLLLVLGGVIVIIAATTLSRKQAVVPSKAQFLGESAYNFIRNGIAADSIGPRDFMRYVPLLFSLFFFILVNNLFGLIPLLQFAPFSRAGFAYGMAGLVWLLYNGVGISRHGFFGYLKLQSVPGGVPWLILPLLVPLEFLSNILVRPVTLSLRLFANMFAGHLLLLLFATGGEYLLLEATGSIVLKPAGIVAFVLGVLVGMLELIVSILQAYVFTLLAAQYIGGALADSH